MLLTYCIGDLTFANTEPRGRTSSWDRSTHSQVISTHTPGPAFALHIIFCAFVLHPLCYKFLQVGDTWQGKTKTSIAGSPEGREWIRVKCQVMGFFSQDFLPTSKETIKETLLFLKALFRLEAGFRYLKNKHKITLWCLQAFYLIGAFKVLDP